MRKALQFCFPFAWLVICLSGVANAYTLKNNFEKKDRRKKNTQSLTAQMYSDQVIKALTAQASDLSPQVLKLALRAYQHAREQGLDKRQVLTIINYHQPSTDKRLWVIDLKDNKVLYNTFVAHGKGSGADYATHFSNRPGSLETSLGVFLTGKTFYGNDGYSMRLHGLEPGFNNNAYNRDVVMHGAWYVNQQFIDKYGRLGRSWGCPALSKKMDPKVINAIKGGTLVFAYYPESKWLDDSKYLRPLA